MQETSHEQSMKIFPADGRELL